MKKFAAMMLCLLMLCLAACGKDEQLDPTTAQKPPAQTDPTQPTQPSDPSEPEEPTDDPAVDGKAVTLMVYMIGSDLEAKGGAGTNDLKEMTESGVDLTCTNVVVYAGGSRKWHNDAVESKDVHTLLELTDSGFVPTSTIPESSMGEAECLTQFLNTAYKNYPAQSHALILWNHGSGPLIGYGMDMLHDNDSLTLKEMAAALEASPFGADNKLAWMGFDACLMASAELAVVMDDYAELLVASQEIEPAFGWNYAFLKNLGKTAPTQLLSDMVKTYLATCQAYYDSRGYDHRDTTLACMDLSKAAALETAIEALFKKAAGDVSGKYNQLASSRVETRALGRATTGSEYDLIDLYDMAGQMATLYPAEAAAIQSAVEAMIVANATNAEGCCGMSLYYPFYNKRYYERTWGAVYSELNAFPQYAKYLDSYCDIWLSNDKLENFASSMMPSMKNEEEFILELTDDQAESFASARYYILQREGDELYTRIFTSGNVTRSGNCLVANFDGQILYGRDGLGQYILPIATEHDTVGNLTRYSIYVNLTTSLSDPDYKLESHRFHLTVNNTTKQIFTSALVPGSASVDIDSLSSGKVEDADLSQWINFIFPQELHRYLTRYENGAIKPLNEWPQSDYLSAYQTKVGDGMEFFFAPLVTGEYYLIFEVEDTQGSRYCSDLLPITAEGELDYLPGPEPVEVTWETGEEVFIMEKDGVSLYLTTGKEYNGRAFYALKANNSNDFDVKISCTDGLFDYTVWCPDGWYGKLSVPANSTATDRLGLRFGDAASLGMMDNHSSIQFFVDIETARGDKTILLNQLVSVIFTPQTVVTPQNGAMFGTTEYHYDTPTRGILAKEQVLFEKDGLKATLLGFGGKGGNGDLIGVIRFENTSDESKYPKINGIALDGIFMEIGVPLEIPSGMMLYEVFTLESSKLDLHMIDSPSSLSLLMQFMEYFTLEGGGGFSELQWCPVTLAQKGSGCSYTESDEVVLEENGLRVTVLSREIDDGYFWNCTVVNNTGAGVNLRITEVTVNGVQINVNQFFNGVVIRGGKCDNGQKTIYTISTDEYLGTSPRITFKFQVSDLTAEKVLWESETVTLTWK